MATYTPYSTMPSIRSTKTSCVGTTRDGLSKERTRSRQYRLHIAMTTLEMHSPMTPRPGASSGVHSVQAYGHIERPRRSQFRGIALCLIDQEEKGHSHARGLYLPPARSLLQLYTLSTPTAEKSRQRGYWLLLLRRGSTRSGLTIDRGVWSSSRGEIFAGQVIRLWSRTRIMMGTSRMPSRRSRSWNEGGQAEMEDNKSEDSCRLRMRV